MHTKSVSSKLFVGIDKVIEKFILKRQKTQNSLLNAGFVEQNVGGLQHPKSKFPTKL